MTTRRSGHDALPIVFVALLFFFFFCSLISIGKCQNLDELMQSYGNAISKSMNESGESSSSSSDALRSGMALLAHPGKAKCLEKLSPCKEFMHFQGTPPSSCCDPLTEIATNDTQGCVCIFNSEDLLHSVNITMNDALALAATCGAKPDLSGCKNDAADAPSGSGSAAATISLPPISLESSGGSGHDAAADSSSSSSSDDKKESSGATVTTFGGNKSNLRGLVLTVTVLVGLNLLTLN
ncbi:unnamed protein product [Linum tenue]|uniref:Bifunctional inhibitor/plant lipid transfer protein/seed storage helical domain-containing protein n=1 Tax=Linum tenue TaxID=586396 RepID=A0AAV0IT55_9ROSI|nr:unnamed protein product [Linum tenue]